MAVQTLATTVCPASALTGDHRRLTCSALARRRDRRARILVGDVNEGGSAAGYSATPSRPAQSFDGLVAEFAFELIDRLSPREWARCPAFAAIWRGQDLEGAVCCRGTGAR